MPFERPEGVSGDRDLVWEEFALGRRISRWWLTYVLGRRTTMKRRDSDWVRKILEARIHSGHYPLGSRLPTCRDLATEIGVNRNTVSKAFRALHASGCVEPLPGRGTYVVAVPQDGGKSVAAEVESRLHRVLAEARHRGMDRTQLAHLVEGVLEMVFATPKPRLAFVECNLHDATSMAMQLGACVGADLEPVVLPNLAAVLRKSPGKFALIATTFYHVAEVEEMVADACPLVEVVGIHHAPAERSLLAVAKISRSTRVGLVATNARTLRHLEGIVSNYGKVVEGGALVAERTALESLLGRCSVIVTSPSCREVLRGVWPEERTVVVEFVPSPQSIEFLREKVSKLSIPAAADRTYD